MFIRDCKSYRGAMRIKKKKYSRSLIIIIKPLNFKPLIIKHHAPPHFSLLIRTFSKSVVIDLKFSLGPPLSNLCQSPCSNTLLYFYRLMKRKDSLSTLKKLPKKRSPKVSVQKELKKGIKNQLVSNSFLA